MDLPQTFEKMNKNQKQHLQHINNLYYWFAIFQHHLYQIL